MLPSPQLGLGQLHVLAGHQAVGARTRGLSASLQQLAVARRTTPLGSLPGISPSASQGPRRAAQLPPRRPSPPRQRPRRRDPPLPQQPPARAAGAHAVAGPVGWGRRSPPRRGAGRSTGASGGAGWSTPWLRRRCGRRRGVRGEREHCWPPAPPALTMRGGGTGFAQAPASWEWTTASSAWMIAALPQLRLAESTAVGKQIAE
mmetsp:Transcript_57896/g.154708  ORF Transcript_57896/g.154708 Transcript_57896/m.154708 type:complete len:203 (-) Transcript_57896:1103-1711(-)